ncbi:phenylalanine--tRNA ligase beta subunit-related protein [Latilactobacillus sakei]
MEDLHTTITKQANLEQAQLVTATFGFTNSKKDTAFWDTTLTPLLNEIEADLTLEQIRELPNITATKKAYKAVGLDAARHRPSSDSLLRRVVKGQGLYQINALVDVNNYLSLKLQLPIGSYDLAKIDGPISYQVAEEGAEYARNW